MKPESIAGEYPALILFKKIAGKYVIGGEQDMPRSVESRPEPSVENSRLNNLAKKISSGEFGELKNKQEVLLVSGFSKKQKERLKAFKDKVDKREISKGKQTISIDRVFNQIQAKPGLELSENEVEKIESVKERLRIKGIGGQDDIPSKFYKNELLQDQEKGVSEINGEYTADTQTESLNEKDQLNPEEQARWRAFKRNEQKLFKEAKEIKRIKKSDTSRIYPLAGINPYEPGSHDLLSCLGILGTEFNEVEAGKLKKLKEKIPAGEICSGKGRRIKPKNIGEFVKKIWGKIPDQEKIDPSKNSISPEKWEELLKAINPFDVIYPGSVSEIIYKTLQEQYPELGITIINKSKERILRIEKPCNLLQPVKTNEVYIDLSCTDEIRNKISEIFKDPIIMAINMDGSNDNLAFNIKIAKKLEEEGKVSPNAMERADARVSVKHIKHYQMMKEIGNKTYSWDKFIEETEYDMQANKVIPFSDSEIRQMIKPVIKEIWNAKS